MYVNTGFYLLCIHYTWSRQLEYNLSSLQCKENKRQMPSCFSSLKFLLMIPHIDCLTLQNFHPIKVREYLRNVHFETMMTKICKSVDGIIFYVFLIISCSHFIPQGYFGIFFFFEVYPFKVQSDFLLSLIFFPYSTWHTYQIKHPISSSFPVSIDIMQK